MDFDTNSLYPTAGADKESVYSKIESGYAFTKDLIDIQLDLFKAFDIQSFTEHNAIVRRKNFNPENKFLQHITVTKRVEKAQI